MSDMESGDGAPVARFTAALIAVALIVAVAVMIIVAMG